MKVFFSTKLQTASATMDKMNKFSRTFISLNSLSALVQKRKLKIIAKKFNAWRIEGRGSDPSL